MNIKHTLFISAVSAAFSASLLAQQSAKPADLPDEPQATSAALTRPNGPFAIIDTSMGRITCQFYQRQAPKAVANFIGLAEGTIDWTDPATHKKQHNKPLYNGTTFHRVIPEFMIQGGDPVGTGMGDPGYSFSDEFDPDLNFDAPGKLAMANSGPNTNGSQFFITEQAVPSLNQHYTLFGQCDEPSVAVVKAIARVERDASDKPLTPVILKKVTIVREGQPMPPVVGEALPGVPHSGLPVVSGELISKILPTYPINARNAGVSGTVALKATIGTGGIVRDVSVVGGPQMLQQAALDAVRTWRYRPDLLNGKMLEAHADVSVTFALPGSVNATSTPLH